MARAHARRIIEIDEDDDIDQYDDAPPPSGVSSLNVKICVALAFILALGLMIHLRQSSSNGVPATAAATTSTAVPVVPPQPNKAPPTFSPAVGTLTTASSWSITKINGAYRANGKRIMGNWTLRDEGDNVQFLTSDEKKALGEALNQYDAKNPH